MNIGPTRPRLRWIPLALTTLRLFLGPLALAVRQLRRCHLLSIYSVLCLARTKNGDEIALAADLAARHVGDRNHSPEPFPLRCFTGNAHLHGQGLRALPARLLHGISRVQRSRLVHHGLGGGGFDGKQRDHGDSSHIQSCSG